MTAPLTAFGRLLRAALNRAAAAADRDREAELERRERKRHRGRRAWIHRWRDPDEQR